MTRRNATATSSAATARTRVLVLEEDAGWRDALAGTYRSALGPAARVLTADDAASAERQLRRQPVDVLSLDLDLSEGRSGDGGPLLCDTGRLRLIDQAARRRWAGAVVLIARSDERSRSRFIACDVAKLDEAAVSPDEFVRRRFGGRGLVLHRRPGWDLPTSIARFEEVIRRRLAELVSRGYTLRFGGTTWAPRVTIESGRRSVAAFEGADALLLAALALAAPEGEMVGDGSVLKIYRGREASAAAGGAEATRLAQREIDGFRRRLRRRGVDDRALIHRVRRSAAVEPATAEPPDAPSGGSWRLDGAVTLEGMSPLNVRARGGHDYRPEFSTRPQDDE